MAGLLAARLGDGRHRVVVVMAGCGLVRRAGSRLPGMHGRAAAQRPAELTPGSVCGRFEIMAIAIIEIARRTAAPAAMPRLIIVMLIRWLFIISSTFRICCVPLPAH